MSFESEIEKRTIQRWSRLAIQLNGAADSGKYDAVTTGVVIGQLKTGDLFALLERTLAAEVWAISRLTEVDRHVLAQQWKAMAEAYEPRQFHVERNGLALLVAYLLHLIDNAHATIPA